MFFTPFFHHLFTIVMKKTYNSNPPVIDNNFFRVYNDDNKGKYPYKENKSENGSNGRFSAEERFDRIRFI